MKITLLLFCVGLLLFSPATKADDKGLTIEEDGFKVHLGLRRMKPEDYLKIEMAKMVRSFSDNPDELYKNLPAAVDLSAEFPSIANQGNQNSCTGWAIAYAVKSLQENRELGWKLSEEHLFSPSFVYNQSNDGKDEGAYLVDALNVLKTVGTVPLTLMPYKEADYTSKPSNELKQLGTAFRALGYRRLNEKDVNQIKSFLAAGEPVILIVEIFQNFLKKGMDESGAIYSKASGSSYGGHAIVAVGYDDGKKAIKIFNSWGDEWGEKGYGWIAYDLFPQVVYETYTVYDTPTPEAAVAAIHKSQNVTVATQTTTQTTTIPTIQTPTAPIVPTNEMLLIVPEEAGITINNKWLRLSDTLQDKEKFFSPQTSVVFQNFGLTSHGAVVEESQLVKNNRVGSMYFRPTDKLKVATNQGITFGTTKEEVRRILKKPDYASDGVAHYLVGNDLYFYHGIDEDWGGMIVTRNAKLGIHYDDKNLVNGMVLDLSFKKSFVNQEDTKAPAAPQKAAQTGNKVDSSEGKIRFTIPDNVKGSFNKYDWGKTGVGYTMTDSGDIMINVKIFYATKAVDDALLKERITSHLSGKKNETYTNFGRKKFGNLEWEGYQSGTDEVFKTTNRIYFGYKGDKFYNVEIYAPMDPEPSWINNFLNSVEVY